MFSSISKSKSHRTSSRRRKPDLEPGQEESLTETWAAEWNQSETKATILFPKPGQYAVLAAYSGDGKTRVITQTTVRIKEPEGVDAVVYRMLGR